MVRHKEAIHSGHFMVSNFEAEAQDDEEDIAVPVSEDDLENHLVCKFLGSALIHVVSFYLHILKVPEEEEGVNLPTPDIKQENVKSRFT